MANTGHAGLRPLEPDFFRRPADAVAPELLGKWLLRCGDDRPVGGRIVEAEAYLPQDDPACHAARGRTRRNTSMFGPPGIAYVYAIHSRHCVNAVTDQHEVPSAVLIRAIEPLEGLDVMRRRRGRDRPLELARGPGRLCEALDIDRALDGTSLTEAGGPLWIAEDPHAKSVADRIEVSTRIGVTSAHHLPLRFFIADNRFVSGPRRHR